MKNVVLYARSANSQLEVDRQFQMMQESLDPGADVVGRYSDVGSGMDPHLPELQRALQQVLNSDMDALMVTSLDRLTRSLPELLRLKSIFRIEISEESGTLG